MMMNHWMNNTIFSAPSSFVSSGYQPSVKWPALGASLYGITIWAIKQRKGEALKLKEVAVVHNIVLILISLVTAMGAFQSLRERYDEEGFDGLFCSQRTLASGLDGSAGYWLKVYYVSKFYEFGDTMILAFKQKKIITLHLYHHCVMVFLTWSWVRYGLLEGSLWCALVNSVIHFFMYTYYLLAALGQDVWWKRYLTGCQIFQFVTGFVYVSIFFYRASTKGCGDGSATKVLVVLPTHIVNTSFIIMFYNFFKAGGDGGAKNEKGRSKGTKKDL